MSRTVIRGWETNDATLEGGLTGAGATISTTNVRSGNYCFKCAPASGVAAYSGSATASSRGRWYKTNLQVVTGPTVSRVIAGSNPTSSWVLSIKIRSDKKLDLYVGGSVVGTSTTALTDDTKKYRIEYNAPIGDGDILVKIDGVTEITHAHGGGNNLFPAECVGCTDTAASACEMYFDDYVVDDAGWIGDTKDIILPAQTDSAVGTDWQKPGGGTTDLATSVNNTPPVGIANSTSSADAEKQIRNAGNNSANYVANLQIYDEVIAAADTINAVQAIAVVAAPVSQGAKTGGLAVDNPTQTIQTFTASVAGQFWSGTAQGTYPTGWKVQRNAIIDNPSITRNVSPQLTIDITGGTASRIASVCFMGLYVDYTPAAAAATIAPPPYAGTHRPRFTTPKRRIL